MLDVPGARQHRGPGGVDAARSRQLDLDRLQQISRSVIAPFSAETKSMTVLVERGGRRQLIRKGAADVVIKRCMLLRTPQGDVQLSQRLESVEGAIATQQAAGARVLGLAVRERFSCSGMGRVG